MTKKEKQACLTLYPEIRQFVPLMTDAQLGALIRALVDYRYEGLVTEFEEQSMQVAFIFLSNQIDRMEQLKQRNSENASRPRSKTKLTDPDCQMEQTTVQRLPEVDISASGYPSAEKPSTGIHRNSTRLYTGY